MKRFGWMVLSASVVCLPMLAAAQDDDDQPRRARRVRVTTQTDAASPYWIGVHAVPVSDALKSHLDIGDRLIVGTVMPKGPAADAGVKRHDILLKFGDAELQKIEDLIDAVMANEGKATTLTVIRAGKEKTLDITPTKRPEDITFRPAPGDVRDMFGQWWDLGGDDGRAYRLRMFGPGVYAPHGFFGGHGGAGTIFQLGEDGKRTSIKITRRNDEPTKIVIKRNDETFEATEETLDELPEDLQKLARELLEKQSRRVQPGDPIRPLPFRLIRPGGQGEAELEFEEITPPGGNEFEQLRKDLERLRQEVEKLREGREQDDDGNDDSSASDVSEA